MSLDIFVKTRPWRHTTVSLYLGTLLYVCGCTPSYSPTHPPVADLVPEHYRHTAAASSNWDRQAPWWHLFEDPALTSLMEQLFTGSPDLQISLARYEQAEASLRLNHALRFPSLVLGGQLQRNSRPSFPGNALGTNYQFSLSAAYEIDAWKKISSREKASLLEAQASRETLKALSITLTAQVADLYYLIAEQSEQLTLIDATILSFKETLDRVRWRYTSGLVSALDLYQARQNLAAAQARRPAIETTLAQAEHTLATLLGRPPQKIPVTTRVLPQPPPTPHSGLPADLLLQRPDIQSAWLQVQAGDAKTASTIAEKWPGINLAAEWGRSRTLFGPNLIQGTFWSLGSQITHTLFDAGQRQAQVDRNRAQTRESLAQLRRQVLQALQEVEDALAANLGSEKRVEKLAETVAASQDALRLAKLRYLQGLSDYLPVLTAQERLFNAQSATLQEKRLLLSHRVSLVRALGGFWADSVASDLLNTTERREP